MTILAAARAALRRALGRGPRALPAASPRVVLRLDTRGLPRFNGFRYTVAEGQRLAQRCHTELPEFHAPEHRATTPPSVSLPSGGRSA